MRKIEDAMCAAVAARRTTTLGNTLVLVTGPLVEVYLHGNLIAKRDDMDASYDGWRYTLAGWNTPTTRSRLRALGADIKTVRGVPIANGFGVTDTEWF